MGAERRRCACVEMYRRQHQAISQLKSGLQTNIALCVPHTQCAMRTICWDLGAARKLRGFDRLWGTCDDPIEPGRSYLRGAGKLCTVDGPAQVHTEANNIARSDMGSTRSAPWRTCWEPVYGAAGRGRTRRDRETVRPRTCAFPVQSAASSPSIKRECRDAPFRARFVLPCCLTRSRVPPIFFPQKWGYWQKRFTPPL